MDNQHRKISGYRELDQEEIDLMNAGKELERQCNAFLTDLSMTPEIDQRCVAIAKTNIETAFMYTIKSIARPE